MKGCREMWNKMVSYARKDALLIIDLVMENLLHNCLKLISLCG
jgi:hypothetical protein